MDRGRFIQTLAGMAAYGAVGSPLFRDRLVQQAFGKNRVVDFSRAREDFPSAEIQTYLNNAASHPLSIHTARVLCQYAEWAAYEHDGYWPQWAPEQNKAKRLFARLIGAKENEIAFARSTQEIENNILNGLSPQKVGGNVVTNDLHFSGSIYNYRMRQERGLDVRIVKNRDWQIDLDDMKNVIDGNTRLVSIALVSNVNGYLHDVKEISRIAHENGAFLFADIIQCAGAIPIDVKAMGIDMAACSTYKFLMGSKGFGFFYIREDLQGKVVPPDRFQGGGVRYNYYPWTQESDRSQGEIPIRPKAGPSQYEVALPSYEGVLCAIESIQYILELGVENIRNHVRPLTDRLREELTSIGYKCITPPGNESPIITFICPDPDETRRRMQEANIKVSIYFGNKLRISPSVYNNQQDIEHLIKTLS